MSDGENRDSEVHEIAQPRAGVASDTKAADEAASERKLDLEPVGRSPKFVVRLVLAMLVGLIAAAFVGMKLRGVAANCGAGLIRPGTSVVPTNETDAGH